MSGVWYPRENPFEVVARATHERVAKTTEIGTVVHLLSENIRNVAFSADVEDGKSAVGDPLLGGVFSVFDVAIAFGRHVVAPLDAGIIVVVERGRGLTVVDGVAKVGEAGDHISCVEGEPGTHVGSPNLRVA